MTRPHCRRTPMLERLETRQVLSGVSGLSSDKQYVLELINLVRTNPNAAAVRLTSNLSPDVQATLRSYGLSAGGLQAKMANATPQPPVAYSATLDSVAQNQSQYEADTSTQTHLGPGGAGLGARFAAAGYANPLTEGENTYAYALSADQAMQSFLFDWGVADDGHYKNLLQPGTAAKDAYQEVGIGLVNTANGVGPTVLTQDFGSSQGAGPQILGVSYNDSDHDGFYTPGEGNGGLTIDAVNLSTGVKYETQTGDSGGFQVPVAPNADYQVTAIENGTVVQSQTVHVYDVNKKVDFVFDPSQVARNAPAVSFNGASIGQTATVPVMAPRSRPVIVAAQQLSTPMPTPAPAPAPAPAPTPAPHIDSTPVPVPAPAVEHARPSWVSGWLHYTAINRTAQD